MRVLVAVPTYRRPNELSEFLEATIPQLDSMDATLLVIDNDDEASAQAQVEATMALSARVNYIHEPKPGIAEVRNAGLKIFARGDWDAIVFVDDDEVPESHWLAQLTSYALSSGGGIVTGPVVSIFPPETPDWVIRGGFFQRSIRDTGSTSWTAASNNTLLARSTWVDAGCPQFDPAFSRTGGSDTDFFSRIVIAGGVVRYCAEAVVFERVPHGRMTRQWLRRRGLRMGVVNGIVLRRTTSVGRLLLVGFANLAYGAVMSLTDMPLCRFPQASHWNRFLYGRGLIASQFGWRVQEYSRG
ncbi:GT2 family glycosyltransferase [Microbacterium sp. SLBN-154]|uniref:glycosyltransferase family 2 protein n=1 Tax=Microbacterium sp. SLBN-154 TaxID=2768458 RepID=UPI0011502905|nr:glycosyltransferase family A protein [Microbacterium sp. SLBN-154]TQK18632.1 GT2 family glycosyltransferase [Microbacterium sp. SLBN-154]